MDDRPSLLDYVVFFETEPEWVADTGWYHGARFATQRGEDRVVVTIAPDELEFSLEWWQGDLLRVRLSAVMVNGWAIESSGPRELMRVSFNDDRVRFCELQLKPHVQLDWNMSW